MDARLLLYADGSLRDAFSASSKPHGLYPERRQGWGTVVAAL